MNREEYLNIPKYKSLHEFINSFLYDLDNKAFDLIFNNNFQNNLAKKELVSAHVINDNVTYTLKYIFFEDDKDDLDRINQVNIGFYITLFENDKFEILFFAKSIYSYEEKKFLAANKLTKELRTYLLQIPTRFSKLVKNFIEQSLEYKSEKHVLQADSLKKLHDIASKHTISRTIDEKKGLKKILDELDDYLAKNENVITVLGKSNTKFDFSSLRNDFKRMNLNDDDEKLGQILFYTEGYKSGLCLFRAENDYMLSRW